MKKLTSFILSTGLLLNISLFQATQTLKVKTKNSAKATKHQKPSQSQSKTQQSPEEQLERAIAEDNVTLIRKLLNSNDLAIIWSPLFRKMPRLHNAIIINSPIMVEGTLNLGGNPNMQTPNGTTPLELALTSNSKPEIIHAFITNPKIDLLTPNKDNKLPIELACDNQTLKDVTLDQIATHERTDLIRHLQNVGIFDF